MIVHEQVPSLEAGLEHALIRILGDDAVITDPDALIVYETDGLTAHRVRPRAVLLPSSTEEVAAAVRALNEADAPYVPRGAGTGLSGGAIPLEQSVVLSLARMNRILDIDAANMRATVEPGVTNSRLSAATRPFGLYYAPDPSSQSVCTIGGNVAENAGGPHCLKYGTTLNHILALRVVLPDGTLVDLGTAEATYDLLGVFVGSEGTFGTATEITTRLLPIPEAVETLLAQFATIDGATAAVSAIVARGLLPAALEMVDREATIAVEASVYAAGLSTDAAASLVIEFDGPAAGLSDDAEHAAAICREMGATDVRRARDDNERQRLWYARKKAFGAMGRLAPDLLVQDAVVPRSRLPDVLARVYEIAHAHGLKLCNTFHAGDGNLHPVIPFDRRDEASVVRVERASREIMQACVDAGGSITGEHGVGLDKQDYMPLIFSDTEMNLMCDVRRVFNPRGIANPAKVLPIRTCREWIGPATRRVPDAMKVVSE
jgi:glycolate oxidase subunit GlcD